MVRAGFFEIKQCSLHINIYSNKENVKENTSCDAHYTGIYY
jgi:hypothetical protein